MVQIVRSSTIAHSEVANCSAAPLAATVSVPTIQVGRQPKRSIQRPM